MQPLINLSVDFCTFCLCFTWHLIRVLYILKDTLTRIKADYEYAKANGFKIAGKLVRGAYMAEERQLAAETGSEDPINEGYDKTTEMYHSVVDFVLPLVKAGESGFMVATHNENTILYVLKRYDKSILKLFDFLHFT